MNRENLISCIQLINTPGIGPIGFRKLLRQFGSAENALSALSRKKEVFSRRKAEEEIMMAELKHVEIITAEDEAYPYNLKQIEDFPPILYAKGNIELLKNDNMLAVVGSRSASLSALNLPEELLRILLGKTWLSYRGWLAVLTRRHIREPWKPMAGR